MENGIYVNTLCVCTYICTYIYIYRLAGILLARSSIRSFIYRLGYLILLNSLSSVILIAIKN